MAFLKPLPKLACVFFHCHTFRWLDTEQRDPGRLVESFAWLWRTGAIIEGLDHTLRDHECAQVSFRKINWVLESDTAVLVGNLEV
jgi:hypothetical protein